MRSDDDWEDDWVDDDADNLVVGYAEGLGSVKCRVLLFDADERPVMLEPLRERIGFRRNDG